MSLLKKDDETVDKILGGRLRILQKERGYRFSIDALLLADFVQLQPHEHVLDLGTGSGIICLILSQRWACDKLVGIEVQEEMADMARRSVAMNDLGHRIEICQGDVKAVSCLLLPQSFDVVLFNPPYRKRHSGRINPDRQKAVARHEINATLKDFLSAAAYALKKQGRTYMIYPASRMVELLFQMRSIGIEPKKLRLVHSRPGAEGEFVLVEGLIGGREALKIVPPLVIYDEHGVYSGAMSGIFNALSGLP